MDMDMGMGMGMGWLSRIRPSSTKLGLWAVLTATLLPATAADFSPVVLRRADTQGLVSELFLYDLTQQEIQQLRLRLLQPTEDDTLALSYEPTLADLVPALPAAPGDKLLSMLRPVSTTQRGQTPDAVLIVFQGTTLHARRYRMAAAPVAAGAAAAAASSNVAAESQLPAATMAALKPDASVNANSSIEAASATVVADISLAVKRWAQAWEQRDLAAYAAAYEPGFKGAGGAALASTNSAWLAQRRERILSKRDIKVTLEDIQVSVQRGAPTDAPKAHVRFVQRYRGDALVSVGRKRLGLVLREGVWLIREEVSL
jgi:hypothetical protein